MKSFITTLATLAVAASFAAAEEAKPAAPAPAEAKPKADPEGNFKKLDTNTDNVLTLEEFKLGALGKRDPAKAEATFKARDKDANGKLTLEEFKSRPGKKDAAK